MRRSLLLAGLAALVVLRAGQALLAASAGESDGDPASGATPPQAFISSLQEAVPCTAAVHEPPKEIQSGRSLPPMSLGAPLSVSGLRVVPDEVVHAGTKRAFISGYMYPIPHDANEGLVTTDRLLLSAGPLEGEDISYVSVAVHVGDPVVICYAFTHAAVQPMPDTVEPASSAGGELDPFVDWLPPLLPDGAAPAGELAAVRGRTGYLLPRDNGPGGRVNMLAWIENESTFVEMHGEGVTDTDLRAVAEALAVHGEAGGP